MVKRKTVQVVGLGYIGLPTATVMAKAGFSVHGFDVSASIVEAINKGRPHIYEEGLSELVSEVVEQKLLIASTSPRSADVHIIAVPTPIKNDKSPDLTYVEKATESLTSVIKSGDLVIVESTIPPRTCLDVVAPIILNRLGLRHDFDYMLAHCPERVIPGKILHEIVYNDRIIGGTTSEATHAARDLYAQFVKGDLLLTDATTAEMCKLMENTYRDVNIALANELQLVAEKMGVNILEAIRMANHHPRVNIHQPGIGVGGHCIPIDPWFIIHSDPASAKLMAIARTINDNQPEVVARKVFEAAASLNTQEVTILGLTYKADVDDMRESPAIDIVKSLTNKYGLRVSVHEPYATEYSINKELDGLDIRVLNDIEEIDNKSLCVILVSHKRYAHLDSLLPYLLKVSNGFKLNNIIKA